MTDKELLIAAAKAAGMTLSDEWDTSLVGGIMVGSGHGDLTVWNPLEDDGDALRLAVKLRITVEQCLVEKKVSAYVLAGLRRNHCTSISGNVTREQATRDAIVRVAAAIGSAQ